MYSMILSYVGFVIFPWCRGWRGQWLWWPLQDTSWWRQTHFLRRKRIHRPIPVVTVSRMWVWGHLLAGIAGSNPTGGIDVFCHVTLMCYQVEVSALGWSPVQRNPTECGVSQCDHEASNMSRPWSTRGCCLKGGGRIQ